MIQSVREVFRNKLPKSLQYMPVNMSQVADWMNLHDTTSLTELVNAVAALPELITLDQSVVTGTALGGEAKMVIHRDGSVTYSGFMRATGLPSFSYRIGAIVRSGSGGILLVRQATGKVFGTDTPGDRQSNWSMDDVTLEQRSLIANTWPDICNSTMTVSRTTDLTGVLGTAVDIVKDVAEFLLVAYTAGTAFAMCVVIGSEAGEAGVNIPGLGGVIGIGIIAGSVFIWGPLAIGPAFILGVGVGLAVDAMIKIRELTDEEKNFARQVFADSLDFNRIRLTNLLGAGGVPFTIPTIDGHILMNMGVGPGYDEPIRASRNNEIPGQLFIHEMTHAWQIQNNSIEDAYVPGFLCRAIGEHVIYGQSAYQYGPPGASWQSYGIEGQAAIVDSWFGGNKLQQVPPSGSGTGKPMDTESPWFPYIDNNIRAGIPG